MLRKMPLTDKLRAAVFARDKGICAFSGLSLWMLDYGTAPFGHPDWPDHIVPVSRGGKDTLDNLVCASFFHNRKKLNNTSDRNYLFRNGAPTNMFFQTHGEVSDPQAQLLQRHARIIEADWHFNRALFNIRVALDDEAYGADVVRGRGYWLASAYKRLSTWRKISDDANVASFGRRGLIRYPSAPDVKLMLSLATADEPRMLSVYRQLLRHYRANRKVLDRFCHARTDQARMEALIVGRNALATAPLIKPLRLNAVRLKGVFQAASTYAVALLAAQAS